MAGRGDNCYRPVPFESDTEAILKKTLEKEVLPISVMNLIRRAEFVSRVSLGIPYGRESKFIRDLLEFRLVDYEIIELRTSTLTLEYVAEKGMEGLPKALNLARDHDLNEWVVEKLERLVTSTSYKTGPTFETIWSQIPLGSLVDGVFRPVLIANCVINDPKKRFSIASNPRNEFKYDKNNVNPINVDMVNALIRQGAVIWRNKAPENGRIPASADRPRREVSWTDSGFESAWAGSGSERAGPRSARASPSSSHSGRRQNGQVRPLSLIEKDQLGGSFSGSQKDPNPGPNIDSAQDHYPLHHAASC
ncbi:unnamed protein product [Caenorhabditis auriculariae]|uniref:Uncharacterized protein n=1 Tax=Caenorhabditis auriculariae TaxID=2777116 RepID=A0A8S1HMP4_9PELO|nr:unnamed protein product [Caenorhabditis auriculariae]